MNPPSALANSLLLLLLLLAALSAPAWSARTRIEPRQSDTSTVQGQGQVNILRHTVAVSSLPSQFKHGHLLLSRAVVPRSHIWRAADPFTRDVLLHPDRLDWYVADVSTDGRDTVTINAAFSCLDVGGSRALPLVWWAAYSFAELTNTSSTAGGAQVSQVDGDGSINDITSRCFNAHTIPKEARRVEHRHQHRGIGNAFTKVPEGEILSPVVDDTAVFQAIRDRRLEEDQSNEVVYHPGPGAGLPVTLGLTFENGFRAMVKQGFRVDTTREMHVPITALAAITKHSGARLEEARVAQGETSTNAAILILTVFSTGLALLIAVGLVANHVSDTLIKHSLQARQLPAKKAVERTDGWSVSEKVLLAFHVFGVSILAAPFALAMAEGTIDPRISVEVTTGATVFYGATHPSLSDDLDNFIAGAPFVVTVWISVRHLGNGFVAALTTSLLLIFIFSIVLILAISKRSSEMMPGFKRRWKWFSIWKIYGSLRLLLLSFHRGKEAVLTLLIELHDDVIDENGAVNTEGKKKELLLMQAQEMRERANTRFFRASTKRDDQQIKRFARESLHQALQMKGRARYRLLCTVRLDNKARYEAAMSQSTIYDRHLPREWEYVRRSRNCKGIDWYRTNGVMPPDDALVFARLGLLEYMNYIKSVQIVKNEEKHIGDLDDDGVKCVLLVSPIDRVGDQDGIEDFADAPESRVLDERDRIPDLFAKQMSTDLIEVRWEPGVHKEAVKYGGGVIYFNYVVVDEDHVLELTGESLA